MDVNGKSGVVGLSGNQLKLLALIAMTCDHVGKQLLPQFPLLQIIGRLAFPIFAYMIAEGCKYTKNRRKYLLTMAGVALLCQVVYGAAMGSLYQCILVTFSLSVGLIYVLDEVRKLETKAAWLAGSAAVAGVCFVSVVLPSLLPHTDYAIDYGLWGILLPPMVYTAETKKIKMLAAAASLLLLAVSMGGIQWYGLSALPVLFLYSGERGKRKLKNLFYAYYPLHLAAIYAVSLVL